MLRASGHTMMGRVSMMRGCVAAAVQAVAKAAAGAGANQAAAAAGHVQARALSVAAVPHVPLFARASSLVAPSSAARRAMSTEKAPADTPAFFDDLEHSVGLERAERDAAKAGGDLFYEDWYDAAEGTPTSPVVVTSIQTERIIGVTDPHDDSQVVWGVVREGEPPKQFVEGGEYFVLKKVEGGGGH